MKLLVGTSLVLLCATALSASAQPAPIPIPGFSYNAPSDCPTQQEVWRELQAVAGVSDLRELAHRIQIEWSTRHVAHAFLIVVNFVFDDTQTTREFRGTSCHDISTAASAAVGFWVSSDNAPPEPAIVMQPVVTQPVEQTPQEVPTRVPMRREPQAARLHLQVGAIVASDFLLLPQALFGGGVSFSAQYDSVVASARVRYLAPATFSTSQLAIEASALMVSLLVGAVAVLGDWHIGLLGGIEGGAIFGSARMLQISTPNTAPMLAADVSGLLEWHMFTPLVLTLSVDVGVPLVRPVFVATGPGEVLRSSDVWIGSALGVAWAF